eukprot:706625-Amphidinium_carterae.1
MTLVAFEHSVNGIDFSEFVPVEIGCGRLSWPSWSSSFWLTPSCSTSSSSWPVEIFDWCHTGGMPKPSLIHFGDPTETQRYGEVEFQATTYRVPGDTSQVPFPLLFYMSSLEGTGGIVTTR